MARLQPLTRSELNSVNNAFASAVFFEHKSESESHSPNQILGSENSNPINRNEQMSSPRRRVIKGKRGIHQSGNVDANPNPNSNEFLISMNNNNCFQPPQPPHQLQPQRPSQKRRKRRFDEMSAGSTELAAILRSAGHIRIPTNSLIYVRRETLPFGQLQDHSLVCNAVSPHIFAPSQSQDDTKCCESDKSNAFRVMMSCRSVLSNDVNTNMNTTANDTSNANANATTNANSNGNGNTNANGMEVDSYTTNVGTAEPMNEMSDFQPWVRVFQSHKDATDHWATANPHGKVEEYQVTNKEGIMVVNVNHLKVSSDDEASVRSYALDHGFSGYLLDGRMMLHEPYEYWRLLDDNKKMGRRQYLISDMFRMQNLGKPVAIPNSAMAVPINGFNPF